MGLLWPLQGEKPGDRRQMLQMDDREFWSTPAEKYKGVDEFTLCPEGDLTSEEGTKGEEMAPLNSRRDRFLTHWIPRPRCHLGTVV